MDFKVLDKLSYPVNRGISSDNTSCIEDKLL